MHQRILEGLRFSALGFVADGAAVASDSLVRVAATHDLHAVIVAGQVLHRGCLGSIGEVGDRGVLQTNRLMALAIDRDGADVGSQRLNGDGLLAFGLVVDGTAGDSGALGAFATDRHVTHVAGQALHGERGVFAVHTALAIRSRTGCCVRHRTVDRGVLLGFAAFFDLDRAHVGCEALQCDVTRVDGLVHHHGARIHLGGLLGIACDGDIALVTGQVLHSSGVGVGRVGHRRVAVDAGVLDGCAADFDLGRRR